MAGDKAMEMNPKVPYGPDNPHPLSTRRTALVWEGKYDECWNRREVDVAECAMPMMRTEASGSEEYD